MNVERIAVALDGQIDLLDCTLQALGRDTITKLSGVGIFRPRRAAICPGNGLSVAMVSPGRGKITGIDNSVGDPSGRQHSGKTSDYGNIQRLRVTLSMKRLTRSSINNTVGKIAIGLDGLEGLLDLIGFHGRPPLG